jgi:hypothetical protein
MWLVIKTQCSLTIMIVVKSFCESSGQGGRDVGGFTDKVASDFNHYNPSNFIKWTCEFFIWTKPFIILRENLILLYEYLLNGEHLYKPSVPYGHGLHWSRYGISCHQQNLLQCRMPYQWSCVTELLLVNVAFSCWSFFILHKYYSQNKISIVDL